MSKTYIQTASQMNQEISHRLIILALEKPIDFQTGVTILRILIYHFP